MSENGSTYSYEMRTTPQLDELDMKQICNLFFASFQKEFTPEQLRTKYRSSPLGHSIHALLVHREHGIVGTYNAIPQSFLVMGKPMLLAVSVDTMIHPAHRRDPLHFKRLAKITEDALRIVGVSFIYGFPNNNALKYLLTIVDWKLIGVLPYFVVPLRPGYFLRILKPFNGIWHWLFPRLIETFTLSRNGFENHPQIQRISKPSLANYAGMSSGRSLVPLGENEWMVYSYHQEANGMRIAYLVDFVPVSRKVFALAVAKLAAAHLGADVLAYPGTLPFRPWGVVRLPQNRIPKLLRMCGKSLLNTPESSALLDMRNWHVNLSCFDVR